MANERVTELIRVLIKADPDKNLLAQIEGCNVIVYIFDTYQYRERKCH